MTGNDAICSAGSRSRRRRRRKSKFAHCRSNNSDVFEKSRPALEDVSILKTRGRSCANVRATCEVRRTHFSAIESGIITVVIQNASASNRFLERDAHAFHCSSARFKIRKRRELFPTFKELVLAGCCPTIESSKPSAEVSSDGSSRSNSISLGFVHRNLCVAELGCLYRLQSNAPSKYTF